MSEKQQEKKRENVIRVKSIGTEASLQAALKVVETYQSSITQTMNALREYMNRQTEIAAKTVEMARGAAIINIRPLLDLQKSMQAVEFPMKVSQISSVVPRAMASVDAKLLRYISSLERELSAEKQKNKELLETLQSFKKRLKEKPDYIK